MIELFSNTASSCCFSKEDIGVHLLCCHCKPEPFMMTFCAEGHHFLKAHIEHTDALAKKMS